MSVLLWACVVLMLTGAVMLLIGAGEPTMWIAVTLVGMASFVVAAGGRQHTGEP
jgi:hypothetical protein